MIPATIDYLLGLKDRSGNNVAFPLHNQIIIPNVLPLTTLNYSLTAQSPVEAYIVYELQFGEAMVPHAFDVKVQHSGGYIFNAIVSGQFTTNPFSTFTIVRRKNPALFVSLANTRLLVNYYELSISMLRVASEHDYDIVMDALRRIYTSLKSESLLQTISDKSIGARPLMGGSR